MASQSKFGIIIFQVLLLTMFGTASNCFALMTPHPLKSYDRGDKLLLEYRGDEAKLKAAKVVFGQLIKAFPKSPYGYLGMSRSNVIDAYRYGNHYNMKRVREEALPFAIKALELGAALRDVHENYSVYEQIFEQNELNQKITQKFLELFPEQAETYFMVANFIEDQEQPAKALEYYQAALELKPSDDLKLRLLKRIAMIYLNENDQPEKALDYTQQAIALKGSSPLLSEYLGVVYLKLNQYQSSIDSLTESIKGLPTSTAQYYLEVAQGYAMAEKGTVQGAIGHLEKAAQSGKIDRELHFRLGNLYYQTTNYELAFEHFKQVIDWGGFDAQTYYLAGRSANSLGHDVVARDYFSKFLQIEPQGQEADWIKGHFPDLVQNQISKN